MARIGQGISPSRKSPGRALATFPETSLPPRNSREKLLSSNKSEFSNITPRRGTTTKSVSVVQEDSRILLDELPCLVLFPDYFLSNPTLLLFLFLGTFFFAGVLVSQRWRSNSLPSSTSPDLSRFHSELISLQNELRTLSKRLETVSGSHTQESSELKNYVQSISQMVQQHKVKVDTFINTLLSDSEKSKTEVETKFKTLSSMIHNDERDLKFGNINTTDIERRLNKIYRALYLDGTEKIDWSRAAVGGSIDRRYTSVGINTDLRNTILSSVIPYLPSKYTHRSRPYSKPADMIIGGPESAKMGFVQTDRLEPGYCFAFPGKSGNITINLPSVIAISGIQIDHIAPELSPAIASTPHLIAVYVDGCKANGYTVHTHTEDRRDVKETNMEGFNAESHQQEGSNGEDPFKRSKTKREPCWGRPTLSHAPSLFLGHYEFDYPNVVSETFPIKNPQEQTITRRIRFEILSNHGSEHYTCVYRLRVYGSKIDRPLKYRNEPVGLDQYIEKHEAKSNDDNIYREL